MLVSTGGAVVMVRGSSGGMAGLKIFGGFAEASPQFAQKVEGA
jgi:hypothetical protein